MNCEFYQTKHICRADGGKCNDPNFCRLLNVPITDKPLVENLMEELKPREKSKLSRVIQNLLQTPALNR